MAYSSRALVETVVGLIGSVAAFLWWWSLGSVFAAASGSWVSPILWASIVAVSFFSVGILFASPLKRVIFSVAVLAPSLVFAPTVTHFLLVVAGIVLFSVSFGKMRSNMDSRLSLSFQRSMGFGSFLFIFSAALLVASQYFSVVRADSWQELVPGFSFAEGAGDTVLRVAGAVYPELGVVSDESMTVDAFLRHLRETKESEEESRPSVSDATDAFSLAAGRAELGELVGRELSGTERMGDVLAEALRNKTVAFLSATKAERNLPNGALPFFLAMLLFITVLSIGSILRIVWILLAAGLLRLLIRLGALSVEKIPAEQEVLR